MASYAHDKDSLMSDDQFYALRKYLRDKTYICSHTLVNTLKWIKANSLEIRPNMQTIMGFSAHCDCEVLMNIKVKDWHDKERGYNGVFDVLGKDEAEEFVTHKILMANMQLQSFRAR